MLEISYIIQGQDCKLLVERLKFLHVHIEQTEKIHVASLVVPNNTHYFPTLREGNLHQLPKYSVPTRSREVAVLAAQPYFAPLGTTVRHREHYSVLLAGLLAARW